MRDSVKSLDSAISMMSSKRHIIYFKSENRHIIEKAVNTSTVLWNKLKLSVESKKHGQDQNRFRFLIRTGEIVRMNQIFEFKNFTGAMKLDNKAVKPAAVILTDFQIYDEKSQKKRSQMVKAFLDCEELREAYLLISSPESLIPDGFSSEIELISDSYISEHDIMEKLLEEVREEEKGRGIKENSAQAFQESQLKQIAKDFVGLTEEQVDTVLQYLKPQLCKKLRDKDQYLARISQERKMEADKDPAITFIEYENAERVVGLGHYTEWLNERIEDFHDPERAKREGTPAPKGVLLCGVPGTGKTAMARETARALGVPLVKFDISRLQDKGFGESESRLRRYLERISAFGSCVMLMDEIEKTFGVKDDKSAHEVRLSMLSQLLDWMQTRKANVLTFITANSIAQLPPELIRDGRINGRFFAFMPMRDDLREILWEKLKEYQNSSVFTDSLNGALKRPTRDTSTDRMLESVFDRIAEDAKARRERGEPRTPFMTGANLESLIEMTFRRLKSKKNYWKPYSLEIFTDQMVACGCSRDFVPQGQSNLRDMAEMWLGAQERQYQDVSNNCKLPFSSYKDGVFQDRLPATDNSYDKFFQETLKEEIEKLSKKNRTGEVYNV